MKPAVGDALAPLDTGYNHFISRYSYIWYRNCISVKTRDETFIEHLPDDKLVNMSPAIFSLGGATLDNEWNHIQQKLMRGLGVVAIENQARI
jgi:hypothetical protein